MVFQSRQPASSGAVDLSSVVLRDGTQALTGNLSFGGNKITNLGAPSAPTDAANKDYVDTAVAGAGGLPAGTNGTVLTFAGGVAVWSGPGGVGTYLKGNSAGSPFFAQIHVSEVTNAVDTSDSRLTNARTPSTSGVNGAVMIYSGGAWGNSGAGTSGQVLTSNGSAAPTWQDASGGGIPDMVHDTGDIITGIGPGGWQVLGAGSDGTVLCMQGGEPAWLSQVGPLSLIATDNIVNGVTVAGSVTHSLSSGIPLNGIGVRFVGYVPNSSSVPKAASSIDSVLTEVNAGNETGVMDLRVWGSAQLLRIVRLSASGMRLDWAARSITVLDNGGSTELDIFRVDGSNYWVYGSSNGTYSGGSVLQAPASGDILLKRGSTNHFAVQSSGITFVGASSTQTTLQGTRIVLSGAITAHDTTANAVSLAATIAHTLSSGTPAAGIGVRVAYATYNSGSTSVNAAATDALLTQVSSGSESGALDVYVMNAGSLTRTYRVTPSSLRLDWTKALTIINSIGSTELDIFRAVGGTNWTYGSSDGANVSSTVLLAPSGGSLYLRKGSTDHLTVNSSGNLWLGTLSFVTTISGSRILLSGPVTVNDTNTNAASVAATFAHTLSSGTAAAGIAVRTSYAAQNASGTQVDAAAIDGVLTTATAGSEVGTLDLYVRSGGALVRFARFTPGGNVLGVTGTVTQYQGGARVPERTVSTNTTLDASDEVIFVDTTAGAVTLTLPAGASGRPFIIQRVAGTNNVIVQRTGGDTIRAGGSSGLTSWTISDGARHGLVYRSGGTEWAAEA